jgi:hypothetical protein
MRKSKRVRRIVLFVAKVALAIALLAWVLHGVHVNDYVVEKEGRSYAVVRAPAPGEAQEYRVSRGTLWWRHERTIPARSLEPIPGTRGREFIRPGFLSTLKGIRAGLFACAVLGFLISWLTISVRWWFLLRIQEIRIPLWEAVRLTFLGQFFNQVVPGTVGGDVVKAYYVSKHTPKTGAAVISIFVDRLLGLTELSFLAAAMITVSLASGLAGLDAVRTPMLFTVAVLAIVVFTLLFLLSVRFRRIFHLQRFYRRLPIAHHIAAAGEAARLYRKRLGKLAQAILITFGAHLMWVGGIAFIGASLSLPTPTYTYFVYIPLIYILGAIPLTPGGVGWVERWYTFFFAACAATQVLALAFLARLVYIFWALPGSIVAVTGPRLPKKEQIEAELGLADG